MVYKENLICIGGHTELLNSQAPTLTQFQGFHLGLGNYRIIQYCEATFIYTVYM